MIKKLAKKIISFILDFIFSFTKIKDNYIIFFSSRNRVDGNPKAIYLYMKKHYKDKYKYKYIVYKGIDVSDLDKDDVCYYRTLKGYYYIACSKYWILSDSVKTLKNKRKGQIYIQTYHGHGPVKRGGFEIDVFRKGPQFEAGIADHVKDWDIYISMCKKDDEHTRNATGYKKPIFHLGIASTDCIVESKNMSEKEKKELRKKYNIPEGKKVILYAPTYREKLLNTEDIDIKINRLKELDDYIVLVRLHPLLNSKIDKSIFDEGNFINVCDVPDIVELYPVVDVLISDYSAAIYEFALTDKKIVLYPFDYDEYEEFPGYIIDYEKTMPGPICYDEDKLVEVFKNEKKYFKDYDKKLKKFNDEFNYLNDGNATKRFVEHLIDKKFDRE